MTEFFHRQSNGDLLHASMIPWDSKVFGFNVCNIDEISSISGKFGKSTWLEFREWIQLNQISLVSIRLNSTLKNEINFLQRNDFLIVEKTCQPVLSDLKNFHGDEEIQIESATDMQMEKVLEIAESSFDISRFHSDSRFNGINVNLRYVNWIRDSLDSNNLWVVTLNGEVVSFFLTEKMGDETYWHLTAVNNRFKGKGFGRRSWVKMLELEHKIGQQSVRTRISLDNLKVLNLYSSLGATFQKLETSLHMHL
jgi:hypothetical protein